MYLYMQDVLCIKSISHRMTLKFINLLILWLQASFKVIQRMDIKINFNVMVMGQNIIQYTVNRYTKTRR